MSRSNADYVKRYRDANPQSRERNNKVGQARDKALSRLAKLYPDIYQTLLAEEKARLGL